MEIEITLPRLFKEPITVLVGDSNTITINPSTEGEKLSYKDIIRGLKEAVHIIDEWVDQLPEHTPEFVDAIKNRKLQRLEGMMKTTVYICDLCKVEIQYFNKEAITPYQNGNGFADYHRLLSQKYAAEHVCLGCINKFSLAIDRLVENIKEANA